jgi:hypothetical protein
MKNQRLTSIFSSSFIACALTIGSLATTQSASAQSSKAIAEVNIPFSFQTATQRMPAGAYRIDRESHSLIMLRGPHAAAFVNTYAAVKVHPVDHGYLLFDHYGNQYFLRQIWTAGQIDGLECPKTRAEKEALQAKNNQKADTVELAFNAIPQH